MPWCLKKHALLQPSPGVGEDADVLALPVDDLIFVQTQDEAREALGRSADGGGDILLGERGVDDFLLAVLVAQESEKAALDILGGQFLADGFGDA